MPIYKWIIILALLIIVWSLFSALYYMLTGKGTNAKMAKALTIRIVLSLVLFFSLFLLFFFGIISPHGVNPYSQ